MLFNFQEFGDFSCCLFATDFEFDSTVVREHTVGFQLFQIYLCMFHGSVYGLSCHKSNGHFNETCFLLLVSVVSFFPFSALILFCTCLSHGPLGSLYFLLDWLYHHYILSLSLWYLFLFLTLFDATLLQHLIHVVANIATSNLILIGVCTLYLFPSFIFNLSMWLSLTEVSWKHRVELYTLIHSNNL